MHTTYTYIGGVDVCRSRAKEGNVANKKKKKLPFCTVYTAIYIYVCALCRMMNSM